MPCGAFAPSASGSAVFTTCSTMRPYFHSTGKLLRTAPITEPHAHSVCIFRAYLSPSRSGWFTAGRSPCFSWDLTLLDTAACRWAFLLSRIRCVPRSRLETQSMISRSGPIPSTYNSPLNPYHFTTRTPCVPFEDIWRSSASISRAKPNVSSSRSYEADCDCHRLNWLQTSTECDCLIAKVNEGIRKRANVAGHGLDRY